MTDNAVSILREDFYRNLISNLADGMPPHTLTEYECELLVEKIGKDWFEKLGYSEPKDRRPHPINGKIFELDDNLQWKEKK